MKLIAMKLLLPGLLICHFCNAYSLEENLIATIQHFSGQESEINQHLTTLRSLAQKSNSVVTFGKPNFVPSWAIFLGLVENFYNAPSYMVFGTTPPSPVALTSAQNISARNNIDFHFIPIDDLEANFDRTDLLFIHSAKTYCQLTYYLEKFEGSVNKYIAIHGTEDSFLEGDLEEIAKWNEKYPHHINRNRQGLWAAVADFLATHPAWDLEWRYVNNNGLAVLKRNTISKRTRKVREAVNDAIQNKIILCTGPSLNRKERLKHVTEQDLELVPFKKIFLTTNDPDIVGITFRDKKPVTQLIPEKGHGVDCFNCIISTIQNVLKDPDCREDDIIFFKHESVYINDMYLFRKVIEKLVKGYDMVDRFFALGNYYNTNAFFIKVSAARNAFTDEMMITSLEPFDMAETHFMEKIIPKVPKIWRQMHFHHNRGIGELGCYHIPPPGDEQYPFSSPPNWGLYWDRSDYNQLYK